MSYTIPYIIEDTGRGERAMDIYSRLLKDRIIFIGTEINDQIANTVIAQLLFLRADDPKKDVNVYINSPGGIITAGLAIFDTMQFMSYEINTYCLGMAASMAALLLMAGTKGKRYALPGANTMIHQPHGGAEGQATDIEIQAKQIVKIREQYANLIAGNTGQTIQKVMEDMDRDRWMDAEEAVEYGLIDKIMAPKK